jgi:predicted nucleic acid-binding protein
MTFDDIPVGTTIFIDANTFVYAFAPDPILGPACQRLLERVELGDIDGVTSANVLSDVAHRLMSIEACAVFGWTFTGVARQLRRHPDKISQLVRFRTAIESVLAIGLRVLPTLAGEVTTACAISQQHGLLSNDALIFVQMQNSGLTQIATHDADFDRVPGITRYSPA